MVPRPRFATPASRALALTLALLGAGLVSTCAGGALPSGTEIGLIVQLVPERASQTLAQLEADGVPVLLAYQSTPAIYVRVPESREAWVSSLPGVKYAEREQPVQFFLSTSRTAIRSTMVTDPATGLKDGGGQPIDGRRVGVAVVDTGVDGTHRDLPYKDLSPANYVIAKNLKVVSTSPSQGLAPMPSTDQSSGHGTHVTGIVAGQGTGNPNVRGVAPGVKIYGLGIGEASTTLWPNQAFDWILGNWNVVDPPIRVVQNSWGSGTAYDPNSLTTQLVNAMVSRGITVVFAAGNGGGNGAAATTTSQCQIPTEGVICVAAYDDLNSGTRNGLIAGFSSRGATNTPFTWPDVSAPGVNIESTVPLAGSVTGADTDGYGTLSGTSMAAPHVSGVVALLYQAKTLSMTPAKAESIIESTAFHYADGGAYASNPDPRYNGSHVAKGHGLVDAYAAVQWAQTNLP